jgi:hypothetical protein
MWRARHAWPLCLVFGVLACGIDPSPEPWRLSADTGAADEPPGTDGEVTAEASSSTSASSTDASSTGASSTFGSDTMLEPDDDSSTGAEQDDCPRVRVEVGAGTTLNVRPTPSTAGDPVGSLPDGAIVDVLEVVTGESIDGNDVWYHIQNDALQGYIFSGFASCTLLEARARPPGQRSTGMAVGGRARG